VLALTNESLTPCVVLYEGRWYSFGYASLVLFLCLLVCLIGAGIVNSLLHKSRHLVYLVYFNIYLINVRLINLGFIRF